MYSNKTVKHSIKTVRSSNMPTQLIQPGYTTVQQSVNQMLYTHTQAYCGVILGSSLEWYKGKHKLRLSVKMSNPVVALLPSNIIEVYLYKTWSVTWLILTYIYNKLTYLIIMRWFSIINVMLYKTQWTVVVLCWKDIPTLHNNCCTHSMHNGSMNYHMKATV